MHSPEIHGEFPSQIHKTPFKEPVAREFFTHDWIVRLALVNFAHIPSVAHPKVHTSSDASHLVALYASHRSKLSQYVIPQVIYELYFPYIAFVLSKYDPIFPRLPTATPSGAVNLGPANILQPSIQDRMDE